MVAPIVSVHGEVTREVDPEIARVWINLSVRDPDREIALLKLKERAADLRGLLDTFDQAIERRETSGLHVYPVTWTQGQPVAEYAGNLSVTVTVHDFSVLGDMMLAFTAGDDTSVGGPWWALRPTSPAYAQARRDAIDEAITRARTYAEALGSTITRLIELADEGAATDGVSHQMRNASFGARAASLGAGDGSLTLELDQQPQTVTARILARFEISEPTVL